MTQDELIEAMARALDPEVWDARYDANPPVAREISLEQATTALSAIEAVAAVVPKDATEDQLEAAIAAMRKPRMRLNYTPADDRVTLCVAFKAMLAASPFRSKP
jgi:hypothetical protein